MTATVKPVTITRFTQPISDPVASGAADYLIPWSEVRDGDFVLIDDALTLVEEVWVCLDQWGDGTVFIRTDVTTLRDNGTRSSGEHKGDLLTCVRRAHNDIPQPMTEAWVAWVQDETVPDDDCCRCRLSRYSPHPRTPEHGHYEGSRP